MVSALFVRRDSVYKAMGIDSWDMDRDATRWPGGNSAIFHPPCRMWGSFKHWSIGTSEERELAIWSTNQVRLWGGVLEHPQRSSLWDVCSLPKGLNRDCYGGFSLSINQSWFGYRAEKKTLLYIVGIEPSVVPPYPLSFDLPERVINWSRGTRGMRKHVPKDERDKTVSAFAHWLVQIGEACDKVINPANNIEVGAMDL